MKIGITGSRFGITVIQMHHATEILRQYMMFDNVEFHHGDCMGADVMMAQIAKDLGYKIICHPPIKDACRGFFPSNDFEHVKKSYVSRDKHIAETVDLLIGLPKSDECLSGTWLTVNHARSVGTPAHVFLRDGTHKDFSGDKDLESYVY